MTSAVTATKRHKRTPIVPAGGDFTAGTAGAINPNQLGVSGTCSLICRVGLFAPMAGIWHMADIGLTTGPGPQQISTGVLSLLLIGLALSIILLICHSLLLHSIL